MAPVLPDAAATTVEALTRARHVLALTGAGISAESGIPTFREAQQGLWAQYAPEQLATPAAFAEDPLRVWQWYVWRRTLVHQAVPNAGHEALVALAGLVPEFTLVTQNVDGLHQRAGATQVIEFHGNLLRDRCSAGCGVMQAAADDRREPPACPRCQAPLRPDVVWFGEAIPQAALAAAMAAAEDCDLLLSIGTSSLVYPAAGLAEIALRAGARIIEVNPAETPLSPLAHARLCEPAAVSLPGLVTALRARR